MSDIQAYIPPVFSFDFSLNKPALSSYINGKLSFHVFPMYLDDLSEDILKLAGVDVVNRRWEKIHDVAKDSHELIVQHVLRANALADMIIQTMESILSDELPNTNYSNLDDIIENSYVINEGLAFAAKGDAALDLSGYKYVFMYKMMEHGFKKFRTYQPTTIKSVAGCAKKGEGKTKDRMIEAFRWDTTLPETRFQSLMKEDPHSLKKKTAYVDCVDDIVDSYWNLVTFLKKEGIIK